MENKDKPYFDDCFVDYRARSGESDRKALERAKQLEEKYKDRLVRVDTANGYVMTTRPQDFEHLKVKKNER